MAVSDQEVFYQLLPVCSSFLQYSFVLLGFDLNCAAKQDRPESRKEITKGRGKKVMMNYYRGPILLVNEALSPQKYSATQNTGLQVRSTIYRHILLIRTGRKYRYLGYAIEL